MAFVDIAGLVRGASKGEGLGNQFLGNIREVDAIIHVLRCFENGDVTHVEGKVDPIADAETVETELMLSDLESLEKRVPNFVKKAAQGDKEAKIAASVLGQGARPVARRQARAADRSQGRRRSAASCRRRSSSPPSPSSMSAMSMKPTPRTATRIRRGCSMVLEGRGRRGGGRLRGDRGGYRNDAGGGPRRIPRRRLGLHETGLARVITAGYRVAPFADLLHRSVPRKHAPGPSTAVRPHRRPPGEIHTDFEKGFIRAEDDRVATITSRWAGKRRAREAGKLRSEGKDYLVQDGDVMHFLHS